MPNSQPMVEMQDIIEYEFIVVPFRSFLEDVVEPAGVERVFLEFGAVPGRRVLGKTFQHEKCADKSSGIYGGVDPHPVPPGVGIGPGGGTGVDCLRTSRYRKQGIYPHRISVQHRRFRRSGHFIFRRCLDPDARRGGFHYQFIFRNYAESVCILGACGCRSAESDERQDDTFHNVSGLHHVTDIFCKFHVS